MYSFGINLVDVCIVLILLFYMRDGYRKGFYAVGFEMISFLLGISLALLVSNPLGGWASDALGMSRPFAKVLAFIFAWLAVETTVPILTAHLYMRVPALWLQSKWNSFCGVIPATLEAVLLCAFLLTLAISFPFPPILKQSIFASFFGAPLIRASQAAESFAAGVFGEGGQETLAFMTVGGAENETVGLGFTTVETFPNPDVERRMFDLVNSERVQAGLQPLVMDSSLVEMARKHGADMFERGYFGHISPEGYDVAHRAEEAGVSYAKIGENLAYAPDVTIAHTGLMRNSSYRDTVLSSEFTRVGIGVQDAGANGQMFVQVFADWGRHEE